MGSVSLPIIFRKNKIYVTTLAFFIVCTALNVRHAMFSVNSNDHALQLLMVAIFYIDHVQFALISDPTSVLSIHPVAL